MKGSMITKYGFRIRTRNGAIVENLAIFGRDAPEAQRKLLQMYIGCEILATFCLSATCQVRGSSASFEDVMELIATPV